MQYPKVAVIGLGFMGRTHSQTLRRLGIEVYGIGGISDDEAKNAAQELVIPKWCRSFDEAVADNDIKVVHLFTPNNLHFQQAKKALEMGKHVLCEKPLAMTPNESRELAAWLKRKTWSPLLTITCGFIQFARKLVPEFWTATLAPLI